MLFRSSDLSNIAQTKQGKGPGYARALTVFVPKLKEAGADEKLLKQIMNDNPRRFLAFVGAGEVGLPGDLRRALFRAL